MEKRSFNLENVIAIILAFVGGMLDVYCLFNFGLYGMMQTGNVIKLVMHLIDGNINMFLVTLLIVFSFVIGLFLAYLIKFLQKQPSTTIFFILAIIVLFCIILVPNDQETGKITSFEYIAALLFGLEGAFIIHAFSNFGNNATSSAMMTANLNRLVNTVFISAKEKDKSYRSVILTYALILISFMLGIAGGYTYLKFIPVINDGFMSLYEYNLILFVPFVLLIVTLLFKLKINKQIRD